jgi:hypothetical protein
MSIRLIVSCVCSFAFGALLFGLAFGLPTSAATAGVAATSQDARGADREAIRAHIEKIFNAFVNSDCDTIRATHSQNWIGFTGNSRSIEKGIDNYMKATARFCLGGERQNPTRMSGYKLAEIDYAFYGDVALVPYVAETTYGNPPRVQGKLRSIDIYAKLNGEWIQVGSNIFPHPDMLAAMRSNPGQLTPPDQKALLESREAVWRAYFANDQAQLEKLIPSDAMSIGDTNIINKQADILEASKNLAAQGGKLVRLEFPKTEMQVYGDTAILYTTYLFEVAGAQDRRLTQSGRGIEVFVKRAGTWLNTGWHLQPDKN